LTCRTNIDELPSFETFPNDSLVFIDVGVDLPNLRPVNVRRLETTMGAVVLGV
jgi:hypothetical protein